MGRKTKIVVAVAGSLLLGVGAFSLVLLARTGAFRSVEPHFAGSCRAVGGVGGAEDIALDEEAGLAFVSKADFRALAAGRPTSGAILAYDLATRREPTPMDLDMDGPFNPHGISLLREPGGRRLIFAVNHPTRADSRVEVLEVAGATRLRHLRTVALPEMVSLNDVVAVAPDAFYATNDAGARPGRWLHSLETLLMLPGSSVILVEGGRARTVAAGLSFANGIELSADGRTLFVAETTGRALQSYSRDPATGDLALRARHRIPTGLDNVTRGPDGALWIGAHPRMLDFLAHAADPSRPSPSQVLEVVFRDDGAAVREVYLGDGRELSGSSVAVPVGARRVLIGSVFETHLLDCELPP